ncbi:MAG TPA: hypothetical protein VF189_00940 [Patescibacteria group bacterium]
MIWVIFTSFILIGVFLEALVIKIPFALLLIILAIVFSKKAWIILLSIPIGLTVDFLLFRIIGTTSLFFIVMISLFLGYSKKFEIESIGFVIFATLISTFFYFIIFGADNILLQMILSLVFAILGFFIALIIKEKTTTSKPLYLDKIP